MLGKTKRLRALNSPVRKALLTAAFLTLLGVLLGGFDWESAMRCAARQINSRIYSGR